MRTNIITPITPEMRQSLPEGYAIYGNGNDEFAALVKGSGCLSLLAYRESGLWASPLFNKFWDGTSRNMVYAIPAGSTLYSLLSEDDTQNEEPRTIAQMLGVTEFPFEILDKRGNPTYYEDSDGDWWKREYNSIGKVTYYEDSCGYWAKYEYDSMGNWTYYEDSNGLEEHRGLVHKLTRS